MGEGYPPRVPNPDAVWERCRTAMMDLVLERGYADCTREAVIARAAVGDAEFDERFVDLEDCFRQVANANIAYFSTVVLGAYEGEGEWRERLRSTAYAAAWFFEANPRMSLFANLRGVSDFVDAERDQILQRLVGAIDDGRQCLDEPGSAGRGVAESVIGAIQTRVVSGLGAGEATRARDFVPELMYIAVRPYLGHEAAVEELSIPAPPD